jgi:hypothetical protein
VALVFQSAKQVSALVELNGAIAWENYRSRFNRTFAIEAEGFSKGQFCPVREPA